MKDGAPLAVGRSPSRVLGGKSRVLIKPKRFRVAALTCCRIVDYSTLRSCSVNEKCEESLYCASPALVSMWTDGYRACPPRPQKRYLRGPLPRLLPSSMGYSMPAPELQQPVAPVVRQAAAVPFSWVEAYVESKAC